MEKKSNQFFVYIFGDQLRSSVNIGIAGNLHQHVQLVAGKSGHMSDTGPADQKLVYYEYFSEENVALAREKQLKDNTKDANFMLIESMNPNWLDLSDTLY